MQWIVYNKKFRTSGYKQVDLDISKENPGLENLVEKGWNGN